MFIFNSTTTLCPSWTNWSKLFLSFSHLPLPSSLLTSPFLPSIQTFGKHNQPTNSFTAIEMILNSGTANFVNTEIVSSDIVNYGVCAYLGYFLISFQILIFFFFFFIFFLFSFFFFLFSFFFFLFSFFFFLFSFFFFIFYFLFFIFYFLFFIFYFLFFIFYFLFFIFYFLLLFFYLFIFCLFLFNRQMQSGLL